MHTVYRPYYFTPYFVCFIRNYDNNLNTRVDRCVFNNRNKGATRTIILNVDAISDILLS